MGMWTWVGKGRVGGMLEGWSVGEGFKEEEGGKGERSWGRMEGYTPVVFLGKVLRSSPSFMSMGLGGWGGRGIWRRRLFGRSRIRWIYDAILVWYLACFYSLWEIAWRELFVFFFLVVMGICCCFFISFFLLYYPGLSCLIIALYRQPRYCLVMYLNSAEDAFTVIIIVSYVLRYLLEWLLSISIFSPSNYLHI